MKIYRINSIEDYINSLNHIAEETEPHKNGLLVLDSKTNKPVGVVDGSFSITELGDINELSKKMFPDGKNKFLVMIPRYAYYLKETLVYAIEENMKMM